MSRRLGAFALLTAALATVATMLVASPANAATSYTQITNDANRKCIDVATQNNYTVQLWSCNGQSQQKWNEGLIAGGAWIFTNQRTNACLDVAGRSPNAGALLVVQPCGTSYYQRWDIISVGYGSHGYYQQLRNEGSGLCLDLYNNSSTNGTPLQQWWCYDTSAQYWNL